MENFTLLVEQSCGGDREAFARIVRKYQGMVSAVTLNVTGDHAQSEDLAQETFLTAWRKLPELREPEKLASWFYGIAKRVALHWREKQRNNPLRGAAELDAEEIVDRKFQAEQRQRKREQSLELVWSTVKELPETFREPLLLYYRYSRSVADIAESMALSEETVRQRLSRGRRMLKAEVEKQVEQALESTRPDTAFTMAVLASLPLAASMTASVPGTAAAGAGTTGGINTGMGWLFPFTMLIPFFLLAGAVAGLWLAIKHSPTLRTRRFICRSALQWYLFLTALTLTFPYLVAALGNQETETGFLTSVGGLVGFLMLLFYCCVRMVYRWRALLEEDAGIRPVPRSPERSSFSQFNLHCWFWGVLLVCLLPIIVLLCIFFQSARQLILTLQPENFRAFMVYLLFVSCPVMFWTIVFRGLLSTRNEETLSKWSPKNRKRFLPQPEEKTVFFLFCVDILFMFLGAIFPVIPFMIMLFSLMWEQRNLGANGLLMLQMYYMTTMMVFATWIASHSAGIPGKRLDGYIKICLIAGVFSFFLLRQYRLISPAIVLVVIAVYFGTALVCWRLAAR